MITSQIVQSFIRRAEVVKSNALELDVTENMWCQRGCDFVKTEVVAAIPTRHVGQSILVVRETHRQTGDVCYYTADFFGSMAAAGRAGVKPSMHQIIFVNCGQPTRAIVATNDSLTIAEVHVRLANMGLGEQFIAALKLH